VRRSEDLLRRLAELPNLHLDALPLHRIVDRVDIDGAFVREVVEEIVSAHRVRAALVAAEDQVDPLVQVGRYILRFHRFTILPNELCRTLQVRSEGGREGGRGEKRPW